MKTILDYQFTPMVRINALSPNPKVKIFAKLEVQSDGHGPHCGQMMKPPSAKAV